MGRQDLTSLQRPFIEDEEQIIGEILFGHDKEKARNILYKMWRKRDRMMKYLENNCGESKPSRNTIEWTHREHSKWFR